MNVAELERLAGGDQPMGEMDCEEVIKHLARRAIAAEKLVEELHDVLKQEDDHWAGTKAALATYEATK